MPSRTDRNDFRCAPSRAVTLAPFLTSLFAVAGCAGGHALAPERAAPAGFAPASSGNARPAAELVGAAVDGWAATAGVPDPLPPCARRVPVADGAALAGALAAASPGDCVMLADGDYDGGRFGLAGTAARPIVVRAEHRGRAVLTEGSFELSGSRYVVIEGLLWTSRGTLKLTDCQHCRVTRLRFRVEDSPSDNRSFIEIGGTTSEWNRVDHNDLGPKRSSGHLVRVSGTKPSLAKHTLVDHNLLHDFEAGRNNGRDSVVLGCCGPWADYQDTFTVVEHNLFVNCDGENELISVKSSSNVIRYNTIRASAGMISFRAGRRNVAEGNFILGADKRGAGGVRLFEDDHLVFNNYIDTEGPPLTLQNGDPPGGGHAAIKRAQVVFNTFVVRDRPVQVGGGSRTVAPVDTVFANNLVVGTGSVLDAEAAPGIAYRANIELARGAPEIERRPDEVRVIDAGATPALARVGELWRPTPQGPLVGAAMRGFAFVTDDVEGHLRRHDDVGADEEVEIQKDPGSHRTVDMLSPRRPLSPSDVGPDAP